mgnify:CR=1 FL=1
MNRQEILIDQAYCTADHIMADHPDADGWEQVFRMLVKLNVKLDDLDRQPEEQVA